MRIIYTDHLMIMIWLFMTSRGRGKDEGTPCESIHHGTCMIHVLHSLCVYGMPSLKSEILLIIVCKSVWSFLRRSAFHIEL